MQRNKPRRNQTDSAKKRYSNIAVRCPDHGWECPELKEKAENMLMEKITYNSWSSFLYHAHAGVNFKNFKERFGDTRCQFSFYPIVGGFKGKDTSKDNRRGKSSSRRSQSRENERSPSRRQGIVEYNPSETQKQVILEARISGLEASERENKQYRLKNDVELKNLKLSLRNLEKVCNQFNQNVQAVFRKMAANDEEKQECNLDTASIATFAGPESPRKTDFESESDNVAQNIKIVPPLFD